MNLNRLRNNIIETIFVKGGILLLNFAITLFVARFWKAEGKGIIALFVANLGIISIVCNIFTSSSVSYFFRKVGQSILATQAYIWVIFVSIFFSGILFLIDKNNIIYLFLLIVSILFGFIVFHSSLFLGNQKIPFYNLISFLQPALLLGIMIFIYFVFDDNVGYYAYFYSQIISLLIVFIIAKLISNKLYGKHKFELSKRGIKQSFNFGWKTELSNFLQFFNYRFSMYILLYFTDVASVGVFSVGIAFAEAIWIFSKSISVVQYSNVLKTGNNNSSRAETAKVSFYALYASLFCVLVIVLLPAKLFVIVFGEGFENVKNVILLLSPGILAISISNVYGNFFSAVGKLKILIIKSAVGLAVTVILTFLLIPRWELYGACIANASAYLVSSIILIINFYRIK